MVNERAHARLIEGFARIFALCGEMRDVIATMRARFTQQGFIPEPGASVYAHVAELERATTVLMRDYLAWASPLDTSDEESLESRDGGGRR